MASDNDSSVIMTTVTEDALLNQKKTSTFVPGKGMVSSFQSEEAREHVARSSRPALNAEPVHAEVGVASPEFKGELAVDLAEVNRMVTIRPRVSLPSVRIGQSIYTFTANKACIVPNHVATLLDEKGYL